MARESAYPEELKQSAIAIAEASGAAQAERETGIPAATVRSWLHRAGKKTDRAQRMARSQRNGRNGATSTVAKARRNPPADTIQRDEKGRWLSGQSGNPSGGTSAARQARMEAERFSPRAIELLKQIALNPKERIYARLDAIKELLDRGLGKAPQALKVDLTDEHRYVVDITQRIVADPGAARLADELLARVAGDAGGLRMARLPWEVEAGEAPAPPESGAD